MKTGKKYTGESGPRGTAAVLNAVIFLTGLLLLLYPAVSDYWNSIHQTRAIADYEDKVAQLDQELYEKYWQEAVEYNKNWAEKAEHWILSEQEKREYDRILNVDGTGIMGSVEIPKLNLKLPIYHGTEEAVLQVAVGHFDKSALPVGGEGTHCILSGHRGLPSAKLFSNLDKLEPGDEFSVYILNEIITYEIDQIKVVLPDEMEELEPVPGEDLCTLVTCTPYGINSHRLLVRGRKTEAADEAGRK